MKNVGPVHKAGKKVAITCAENVRLFLSSHLSLNICCCFFNFVFLSNNILVCEELILDY